MKRTTRNILSRIGLMILLAGFTTLAVSAKIKRDRLVATDLDIAIDHTNGCFFITEPDVRTALADLLPDSGAVLDTRELKALESRLTAIPQIASSNAFVSSTGHLSIDIRQRQPMYRIVRPSGSSYYVDANGLKFPVSGNYTARVPVVTGFVADNGKDSGMVGTGMGSDLFRIFRALDSDPFWAAQFGQLEISDKGEYILIPRAGSHKILLGNAESIDDKLKRLRIFYHEGLSHTGWETYSLINLKFKNQVVCKK